MGAWNADWAPVDIDASANSSYAATGSARCNIANNISNHFNFGGKSSTEDTACSSSLSAMDTALDKYEEYYKTIEFG